MGFPILDLWYCPLLCLCFGDKQIIEVQKIEAKGVERVSGKVQSTNDV